MIETILKNSTHPSLGTRPMSLLNTYDIIRGNWSIPECGSGDSFELTRVYY